MIVQGSVLTNKYAEGYPSKRYYGGCEFADEAEELAKERLCELFGSKFANVQPHLVRAHGGLSRTSGTRRWNFGMDLSQGGHLTHGSPVNFSGILYKAHSFGLNEEERIDMSRSESLQFNINPK